MQVLLTVGIVAVTVFTLVDAIRIDSSRVRHLDRAVWVIIILLVPLVGILLWWTIGRAYWPAPARRVASEPYRASRIAEPLTDEELDAAVEAEIQRHENEARIRRLERELRDLKGE